METLSHETVNAILKRFESRADEQNLKGKRRRDAQTEFVLGAITGIDVMNGNPDKTCLPPTIYFGIIRGEYLKPYVPDSHKVNVWFRALDITRAIGIADRYINETSDNTNIVNGLTDQSEEWLLKTYKTEIELWNEMHPG